MKTLGLLALMAASVAVPVKMYKEVSPAASTATAINSAYYTGWLSVPTSRSIAIEITYVYSAATAVTMSCQTTDDRSTANGSGFDIHALATSSGTSTSVPHTWSNAISTASENWTWTVANLPHDYINCVFNGTSADGNDTVSFKYRRITP